MCNSIKFIALFQESFGLLVDFWSEIHTYANLRYIKLHTQIVAHDSCYNITQTPNVSVRRDLLYNTTLNSSFCTFCTPLGDPHHQCLDSTQRACNRSTDPTN